MVKVMVMTKRDDQMLQLEKKKKEKNKKHVLIKAKVSNRFLFW